MLVAVIVGRQGLNTLLVASQVVLSFVLPFVVFPLLWVTSSRALMSVRRDGASESFETASLRSTDPERGSDAAVDFSNGKMVMALGYAIWLVIVVANSYVLVTLAMGKGS